MSFLYSLPSVVQEDTPEVDMYGLELRSGYQCLICTQKNIEKAKERATSSNATQQLMTVFFEYHGLNTHFHRLHPKENLEDNITYKKIKLRKQVPQTVIINKYTYTCYICAKVFKHPLFKAHFRKNHPEEKYDRSKIIETKGIYNRLNLIMCLCRHIRGVIG